MNDPQEIRALFVRHFCNLFGANGVNEGGFVEEASNALGFDFLDSLEVRISDHDRVELDKPFSVKEVERAVFQMGGLKARGPGWVHYGLLSKELGCGG